MICNQTTGDYNYAKPNKDILTMLNLLYDKGNRIIIYTSRFMGRNDGDIIKTYKDGYNFTYKQLQAWGVKFHDLFLGKPRYDILIDDRSIFFDDNPEKIINYIDQNS